MITYLCWSCEKEHNGENISTTARDIRCDCGGFVVTPSGKVMMRVVGELK